jgi:hypothetical protein
MRDLRAVIMVNATKSASTTSCVSRNGDSDCVGAIAFRAGGLHHPNEDIQVSASYLSLCSLISESLCAVVER